jgi:hypothetical protein
MTPANQDPYGDPGRYSEQYSNDTRSASEDPYGDPGDSYEYEDEDGRRRRRRERD